MIFSSITFIYYFLPIALLVYYIVPKNFKNVVLLLASLIFYLSGEGWYVSLLLFSSVSDYLHSLAIEKCRGRKKAKYILISSIVINIALLGYFKYTDFFISNINAVLNTNIPLLHVKLPVGISFFTFQTMSYTIDVYRGRVKAQKSLTSLATFVCLFPQLVAGPIVRYSDIDAQLENRTNTISQISYGIERFVIGLGKKVIIANNMGELCKLFLESNEQTILFAWLYAIGFTLQIYFDFSGYSDMAIGLGSMFGFDFPENFNYPYISKSITEFWRRWHMTLSSWFKDYVYIPMGGNRVSTPRWILNLVTVWFLTGFWHGAQWNFILWGMLFGTVLVFEKLILAKYLEITPKIINHIYVLFIVIISFVIFNAVNITQAFKDVGMLFGIGTTSFAGTESIYYLKSYAVLLIIAMIGSTPTAKNICNKMFSTNTGKKVEIVLKPLWIIFIMVICTAYIVDGSFNPFLYFRF